ncbi:MAG TPA: TetR-like C-terminal domain-containing protein [Allosphingosinicella sp.]|jgi:AcrR family transcriptional regulator
MAKDSNSVKIGDRSYHHGALAPALIAAAEAVIAERGVDGFSLRETARRAGVSPSAPAHHFGDARGLLTAIATAGFVALGDALEAADASGTREERMRAQGFAYVRFALSHRARFDVMWRAALLDQADEALQAAGRRAFGLLDRAVRGEGAVHCGPADPAVAPSIACWSMVHGFARLAIDGAFGTEPQAADHAADAMLAAVLDQLKV